MKMINRVFALLLVATIWDCVPICQMPAEAVVSTTAPRNDYVGTGSVATYSYTFKIFTATDLRVTTRDTSGVETTLTYPTDYTVTGAGSSSGGTITLTAGNLTSGYALTIRFDRTPRQSTDLRNQGSFFPETHEDKFDELTRYSQQLEDVTDRSIHLPETEAGTAAATTLPAASSRADKFLAWDSSGNVIAAAGTSGTLGPVSSYINTLLDDATAAAARTTLDVPSNAEAVLDTIMSAKGDLLTATAASTPARLAVGTDGQVLVADSTTSSGLAYRDPQIIGFSTGDVKLTLKTSADSGWVLMNDGTIGSASSGATTRANADTQSLYTLIWTNVADQWAPVTGGRGASAAADFSANKPIALPKTLGRALAGYGTGSTVETVTSQAATSNAIPVQSNNTKWVTGMFVTLSNVSGFAGLSNGTYYVVRASSTTVKFASSLANAQNGTVLTVTGTGSFTMTYTFTTRALGEQAGEEAHAMSITELLSHNHTTNLATVGGGADPTGGNTPSQTGTSYTGGNAAMNIMQPTAFLNVMIKL